METPLQLNNCLHCRFRSQVTILILVETPLQPNKFDTFHGGMQCHNPYFSGNSFATEVIIALINTFKVGHNPYFSGNSFATRRCN